MGLQLLKAPKNATYLLMIIHRALHKFSCQLSRARHHLPLFLMVNNAAISSPILRSSPAEGACSCILWFFRNFRVHGGLEGGGVNLFLFKTSVALCSWSAYLRNYKVGNASEDGIIFQSSK